MRPAIRAALDRDLYPTSPPAPTVSHRAPRRTGSASLLDRLRQTRTDQPAPSGRRAPSGIQALRNSLLRDLSWLLNSTSLESTQSLEGFDYVRHSVANFGLRSLTGTHAGSAEPAAIERNIRDTLVHFEPRIVPDTIEIRCAPAQTEDGAVTTLVLHISASFSFGTTEHNLTFRGSLDPEVGRIELDAPGAD